jgi:hypothetical protein
MVIELVFFLEFNEMRREIKIILKFGVGIFMLAKIIYSKKYLFG